MALREVGDVILLDQRGTGISKPSLVCSRTRDFPLDKPGDPEEMVRIYQEALRACAQDLKSQGVDLSGYNTNESADDVADLRKALGAQRISLWGISYGTHLGLAVIRRHPEIVHRAILTGVSGPEAELMMLPSTIQEQLLKVDRLFKADPTVNSLIPDFLGLVKSLLAQLEKKPATVEVTDPQTGRPVKVTVGKWDLEFFTSVRVQPTWGIKSLPAWFYPMSRGDFQPLAETALAFRREAIGNLMPYLMVCASGVSRERYRRIQREARRALLGNACNFPYPGIAPALGNPDLGPAFRSPVHSEVPVLFVSGTLDGETPVRMAKEIRSGFPNSQHLIVEGASHGWDLFYFFPRANEIMCGFLKGDPLPTRRVSVLPFRFDPVTPAKRD
jgi:pimeloyl-ACP methyl ester carboxylesterase